MPPSPGGAPGGGAAFDEGALEELEPCVGVPLQGGKPRHRAQEDESRVAVDLRLHETQAFVVGLVRLRQPAGVLEEPSNEGELRGRKP